MEEIGSSKTNTPSSIGSRSDLIESLFNQYSHLLKEETTITPKSFFTSLRSIPILNKLLPPLNEKTELINSLLAEQKSATTYKKWYEASLKLDELLNNNAWKLNPQSDLYDYDLIYNNMMEMKQARLSRDFKLLLYLIRTKWIRNVGNIGDINLYRHSHVGTKKLIEEYINECELSLDYLINGSEVNLDDRYLLGMLIQTRKNIGRTALVLSGGSTFGIFHIGVLITLLESNLLPRIISGSSAGSIIASILCCHTNEEVVMLLHSITEKKFNIFGDGDADKEQQQNNFKRLLNNLSHLLKYGTLFDISGLKQTMIDFVGDLTFREAYNRTGKILNITVSPTSIHEQTRLLNYLTAPNCLIWSVVCASCSLPGVFPSTSIYEKNPKTNEIQEWNNDSSMKYVDGSVDNDLPITRLSEMFNVDHIIAVQVNPHVVPILKVSISNIGGEIENELNNKFKHLLNNCYDFFTCEIIHYLQILNEMDIYKNLSTKLVSILSQNYSGDITILPDFRLRDFVKVFENPTPEFLLDFIIRGAKASWPKVTVINNHCGVEFALDKAISLIRGRLITSSRSKLTYKTSDSLNQPHAYNNANKDSYYTLVSSPILNSNQITSTPVTPEKSKFISSLLPNIKRHYSTSNSTGSQKAIIKHKRNSLSVHHPTPKNANKRDFLRGKSTTSLATLSYNIMDNNQSFSPESTLVNEDEINNDKPDHDGSRAHTEGYNKNQIEYQYSDFRERKNIRKAKSSGNFHNNINELKEHNIDIQKLKYQTERIPYYKNNPYLENNVKFYEIESPTRIYADMSKEKPNLPKVSNNNSLRNSYIGLNRLKDNNLSRSQSNSIYNLKEFNNELLKNLQAPDIRRSITKNVNRDNLVYDFFNLADNQDDDELKGFENGQIDNKIEAYVEDEGEDKDQDTDEEKRQKIDNDEEVNGKDLEDDEVVAGDANDAYDVDAVYDVDDTIDVDEEIATSQEMDDNDVDHFYECN